MNSLLDNVAVIIPSLDPDDKINSTIDSMIAAGFKHVVLVDDGSSLDHKKYFSDALSAHPECSLLVHEVNKGKGRALRDAFEHIYDNMPWCGGVITVDGDGQHTAKDAVRLAEEMVSKKNRVLLGCRDFSQSNVPTHNRLGNRISSFVYSKVYGIHLSDTQTGLRAIPYEYLKAFACDVDGDRYEYETNMLIYIKDHGIPYGEIPIETVYLDDNSSSHFHVFRDSYRIYKPMILFVLGSWIATIVDMLVFTILNSFAIGNLSGSNFVSRALAAAAGFLSVTFNLSFVTSQLFISTAAARIISSLVDFNFSRRHVFKSKASAGSSLWKYYVVAILRMFLSWAGVSILTSVFGAKGIAMTALKVVVDLVLFFLSYKWQREWVFK